MPSNREYYFGASDLQMEAFADRSTFRRSLLLQVLFHGDLIIPDVFLYVSNHLHDIITSGDPIRPFLMEALRNGAIMPAFRNDTNNTFRENLAEIRLQGIQGLHSDADVVCDFLEAAVRGKRQNYRVWPKEPLSVGYQQTLERIFSADPAVVKSAAFEQTWTRTRELRRTILEDVKRDNLGGIRRGDVMNAVHFHVNKDRALVDDVRLIWSRLQDAHLASDVKKFLKWCSYAYQYNQGRMFGLSPSLASMDDVDVEFSRHLATTGTDDQNGMLWNDEFVIPSPEALLTIEPRYLFDVRDGATGADYFDAIEAWQRRPSADSSNILLDKLAKYSGELSRLYIAKGRSVFNWEWHLKARVPEDKIWNRTGLELAKEVVGEFIPHFGLLSLVGPLGAATYEWWPASVSKSVGINQRVSLEIDTKTKRLQVPSAQVTDASFK